MARSIQTINSEIITNVQNDTTLGSLLTSTSQTAKWRLWSYIVATSIAYFEQLMDLFTAEIESKLTLIAPNTPQWIQYQIFKWQYNYQAIYQTDSTASNFGFYYYSVIDTTANVVTQCSVSTLPNRVVSLKCASNSTALTTDQKTQLTAYLKDAIIPAGVSFQLVSVSGDLLTFVGQINYDGQYSDVIQTNVETAITNYLNTLPFDGVVYINKIIDAVINVEGVTNFTITNLTNINALAVTTNLITSSNWIQNSLLPYSGYLQTSDYTGLTYIAN